MGSEFILKKGITNNDDSDPCCNMLKKHEVQVTVKACGPLVILTNEADHLSNLVHVMILTIALLIWFWISLTPWVEFKLVKLIRTICFTGNNMIKFYMDQIKMSIIQQWIN